MSQNDTDNEALMAEVRRMANHHFTTAEVQFYLKTRLTLPRARLWVIHQNHFVKNRRDCWALAMGVAPLDVKREIWHHERDELIGDPRAGGADHYSLSTEEADMFGVTPADIRDAKLHPFVSAAFDAWRLLGTKSWIEAFTSVAMVETINSNSVVSDGGFSYRLRQKLMAELGIQKERLKNRNVHVEADQEHALIMDRVLRRHLKSDHDRQLVKETAEKALVIDRAYRGGLGFAMQEIPPGD